MKQWTLFFILTLGLLQHTFASEVHQGLEVKTLAKSTQSWNKQSLPAYPKGQAEVTILDITIPAHSKLVWHKHPVINAGVLLKGELTVISENKETLTLKAGDSIVELVNTWHYAENKKDEPAQIIVFYAGTKDQPITIKK